MSPSRIGLLTLLCCAITAPPLTAVEPESSSLAAAAGASGSWPQWRGPGGSGIASGGTIPMNWQGPDRVLWKTEIEGRGHSSPVVWGDRVFLTTAIAGEPSAGAEAPKHRVGGREFLHPDSMGANLRHTFKVLAIDRDSGEVAWSETAYEGRVYDNRHKAGSYASPTVATDGHRIYAYFGSQGVYAYDFAGELVWSRDIGNIRSAGLGVGTSPVLYDGVLVLQVDEDEGELSFILGLDAESGEQLWKVARAVQASYTTPILVEDKGGRTQLITSGNEFVIAYDPATGAEIWRAEGLDSHAIHIPLGAEGLVVVTTGYPKKLTKAFDLLGEEDLARRRTARWMYTKGTGYVASNLLYDGLLYLTNDGGVITCLDAATGEIVYEGGRAATGGPYMASLVAADDKILMINRAGDATFFKAGREHEILGTASIDEPVYATPALVDGRIYIRGERHLYAIGGGP